MKIGIDFTIDIEDDENLRAWSETLDDHKTRALVKRQAQFSLIEHLEDYGMLVTIVRDAGDTW